MVNTRQNQSNQDIDEDMPVKDSNVTESSSLNKRDEDMNESDYPRTRDRDGYALSRRRELRTRYPPNRYRDLDRASRHPARACRRVLRMSYVDEIDESDGPYNMDDEDDDDDETIFAVKKRYSPVKTVKRFSRRISRDTRRVLPRSSIEDRSGNEEPSEKVLENGIKQEEEEDGNDHDNDPDHEHDHDQDGENEGLRRSKRQRKLLYDSFNQSWIMDSQRWELPGSHVLKGYPNPYQGQENGENEGGSSNDEPLVRKEVPLRTATSNQNEENDANQAPIVNDDEDLYTKIKRTRRRRIRYSPSNEIPVKTRLRERRPRVRVPESSESEETQSSDGGVVNRRKRSTRREDSSDEFVSRARDNGRVYHLRRNKPVVERFQATSNNSKPTRRSSRLVLCSVRRSRYKPKPDSSSSDEERFERKKAKSLAKARSRCMPLNYKPSDPNQLQKTPVHSSKLSGGGIGPKGPADVDPMAVDTNVRFDKVGGLEGHIKCLKEMVVFPMLYREIFEKFQIQPPKGVLFHGPPGTGKTLIARALANECSQGERKVAFFMRKGADCLSKWVGESERQLRLLFEQAYQMRPSIIFFDEIDGLAPVRSSKQDQIHASIVSTLLALLDGLDDRGEIIVIGATNRIDAIDPALRRPGRFDRELYFPLPGRKEREDILGIHTKPWANPPSKELISYLADKSVGYCGSDLRLLCSEAVVHALRRRYPQIYKSSQKLLLQADSVNVEEDDFKLAQCKIIPASSRVNPCPRARLSNIVAPLLQAQYDKAVLAIKEVFPHASLQSRNETCFKPVYRPHFMICGSDETYGQTSHLAPALLEFMEHIPVHIIHLPTLFEMSNRNPEEAIIQIVREATRNPPSIIYLPCIDKWWDLLPFTAHEIFLDRIQTIPISSPVFLLATSHSSYKSLNSQIKNLFKYEILELKKPNKEERSKFFEPLFTRDAVKHPDPPELKEEDWEELPIAPPPPPPPPSRREMEELHNQEEHKLRELRIFLRDICSKLARNRQFFIFTKPVDVKEVPDYLSIIKQPMDLETMMTNIDLHRYNSAEEFLSDIDLIVRNALEYNPAKDPEDKLIRHRACSLRDTAYTLIKAEMDTDFEEECRKISKKRRDTSVDENNKNNPSREQKNANNAQMSASSNPLEPYIITTDDNKPSTSAENHQSKRRDSLKIRSVPTVRNYLDSNERLKKRKRMGWAKGFLKSRVKRVKKTHEPGTGEKDPKSSLTSSLSNSESNTQDTVIESSQKSAERSSVGKNFTPEKDSSKKAKSVPSVSPQTQTSKTPPSSPNKSLTNEDTPLKSPSKKRRTARQRKLEKELNNAANELLINLESLEKFWSEITEKTNDCSLDSLLDLHSMFSKIIFKYKDVWDRRELIKDLKAELQKLEDLKLITIKTDSYSENHEMTE